MTCRILILDFDKQGLFQATDPNTIARTSELWEKDIQLLSPWGKVCSPGFDDNDDTWTWQPENAGDGPAVLVCGHCTSTMDAAWHFIENRQMNIWDSVIAVEQTAGRGQQKRQWISPAGNIHASWLWPLPDFDEKNKADWGGLLSLVVGFVFARVFKELNVPVRIKWPNDLLLYEQKFGGDRKFGGILVERRDHHILVGTGININYSPEDRLLRDEFAVPATHLAAQGCEMSPLSLWMMLVEKGKSLFEKLVQTSTPAEFIKMIDTQMAWVGKKVLIRQMNADIFEAIILGLAKDGGLRIKKENIEEVMYSGSVIPL
ncbi:MAG: biotin--[acetyl-CoA-carboxylase] ligase [Desulfobacteraceae bacterium]|nr:biotin--[acetyl-CoA-carboxylase] ligase [Desulfobacteraceae bacterium]MBC2755020.1 biotin--[acetyl-CoA-carboxylase] ligase [Desulfobacteraceae bacterium]